MHHTVVSRLNKYEYAQKAEYAFAAPDCRRLYITVTARLCTHAKPKVWTS